MYKKKFNNNDQLNFSKITGDSNPIHLDKSYAKNTLFQGIVVHGLNIVVWALEKSISSKIKDIKRIKINFLNFVSLNEEVFVKKIKNSNKKIQLIIKSKKERKIIIENFISNEKISFQKNHHTLKNKKKK